MTTLEEYRGGRGTPHRCYQCTLGEVYEEYGVGRGYGGPLPMSVFILFIYQFISRNNTEFIQVTGTKKAYPHRGFLYLGDAFLVPVCYGLSSTYVTIHGIGLSLIHISEPTRPY